VWEERRVRPVGADGGRVRGAGGKRKNKNPQIYYLVLCCNKRGGKSETESKTTGFLHASRLLIKVVGTLAVASGDEKGEEEENQNRTNQTQSTDCIKPKSRGRKKQWGKLESRSEAGKNFLRSDPYQKWLKKSANGGYLGI